MSMTYVAELEAVVVVTEKGTIALVRVSKQYIEIVGMIEGGTEYAAWAPDQEVLAIVTREGPFRQNPGLVIMSKEWQLLFEVPLKGDTARGSFITWRGDGQYFAVSLAQKEGFAFHVFNRDGVLQSTSETLLHQKSVICWRPSGNLIACVKSDQSGHQIVFFERNGLKHSLLDLPSFTKEFLIRQVSYSSDSDVLAIFCVSDETSFLLLYTQSNAHFYLVQVISLCVNFSKTFQSAKQISGFQFDPERSSLMFYSSAGEVTWLQWIFEFQVSNQTRMLGCVDYLHPNEPSYLGHALRKDGESREYEKADHGACLRLTNLTGALVPPPMSGSMLPHSLPINLFAFCDAPDTLKTSNLLFSTLDAGRIIRFYEYSSPDHYNYSVPVFLGQITLQKHFILESCHLIRHFQFVSRTCFVFIGAQIGTIDKVYIGNLPQALELNQAVDFGEIEVTFESVDVPFRAYKSCTSFGHYYLQAGNGKVFSLDYEHLIWDLIGAFPAACPQFTVFNYPRFISAKENVYLLGLDNNAKLFIGDRLIAPACTSICLPLHPYFLIYTTSTTLVSLDFKILIDALQKGVGFNELQNVQTVRSIEKNGVIVTVVPNSERVILLQPRGNFETIYPRVLLLSRIRELLTMSPPQFGSAFDIIRTYRLDMNILYDHSPSQWSKYLRDFVAQLNKEESFNLFLSSLSSANALLKFPLYHPANHIAESTPADKVNAVCIALRTEMKNVNPRVFGLSILTSFVKQIPADLESALRHVQSLRDELGVTVSMDALKYLIFLVDIQQLYKVALGLYDFELAAIVAQQSQMDPKEYIPFLEGLKKKPVYRSRYEVDRVLGRWDLALEHLAGGKEDTFDECLELIISRKQFANGLKFYPSHLFPEQHARILKLYAEDLFIAKEFLKAGAAFRSCKEMQSAIECYKQGGDWKSVIILAGLQGLSAADTYILVMETARVLLSSARYAEAGRLFLDFEKDVDEAVAIFCKGGHWMDALQSAFQYGRADLIETGLFTAIHEEWISKREELANATQRVSYCFDRLAILRKEKAEKSLLDDDDKMHDDTVSLASGMSTSSVLSRYTMASQISDYDPNASEIRRAFKDIKKMKRIESKKKKKQIKEGHPLEEEFLVKQLVTLAPSSTKQESISELCRALLLLDQASMASILHHDHSTFCKFYSSLQLVNAFELDYIKKSQSEITAFSMNELDFFQFAHTSLDPNLNNLPPDAARFASKYVADQADGNIFDEPM